ncbi:MULTISPECIES: signal peptidase II [unclassified Bartonella]|uniref:signal peptidase II n=1 Tax=unclassified Bartonella TaxID=2645622 RepID=UPI00300DCCA6
MTHKSFSFFLLGLIFIIGIDQTAKYWVMHNIFLETEIPLLPFLSLYHVHNSGIAFSFFSSFSHWGLIALTLIIIFFLLWLWNNTKDSRYLSRFGLTLIIGGAIGNLIDRIRFHYVIDFILFYIDDIFYFAIFNLADTFITFGVIALLIEEILIWIKEKHHSNHTSSK